MCGIVGIIAKRKSGLFQADLDFFERMLIVDQIRGWDSTGSFTIHNNSTASLIKHDSHPMHTFATKEWEAYKDQSIRTGRVIIGHNRKATQGVINNKNSHPFVHKDIVLVHNGSLTNHKDLNKETEVDSHAICVEIAEKGYLEALKSLKGAWALVWYNTTEQKLYAITNGDRPLSVCENADNIWIASEYPMLTYLHGRDNRKMWDNNSGYLKPFSLRTWNMVGKEPVQETLDLKDKLNFIQPTWNGGSYMERKPFTERPPLSERTLHAIPNGTALTSNTAVSKYPIGTRVIVLPTDISQIYEDGKNKRYAMTGRAYYPGQDMIRVRMLFPLSTMEEDAIDFASEPKLVGEIGHWISLDMKDKDCIATLRNVKSDLMVGTWLDFEIPDTEMKLISEIYKCSKCQGKINPDFASLTSLTTDGQTGWKCVCHECVIKSKDSMALPFQEKLNLRRAV